MRVNNNASADIQRAAALAEAQRDPWLWRLLPAAVALGALASYVYPWGVA